MRIFPLQEVHMERTCKGILSEIGKTQQSRTCNASHACHQRTFLRLETIRPYTLVSHQVKLFIAVAVISLLKDRNIVNTAFMEIFVLIGIHGIYLNADHAEIFSCQLAGFADILDTAL